MATGAAQRGRIEAIFLLAEMYRTVQKISQKMKIMRCTGTKKGAFRVDRGAAPDCGNVCSGEGTKIDNKQAWMWLTIAGNNTPGLKKMTCDA